MGRGTERSRIPSLVNNRGATRAMERNPLGVLGYYKEAGSETNEGCDVEKEAPSGASFFRRFFWDL